MRRPSWRSWVSPLRACGGFPLGDGVDGERLPSAPRVRRFPLPEPKSMQQKLVRSARAEVSRTTTGCGRSTRCPLRACGGFPTLPTFTPIVTGSAPRVRRFPGDVVRGAGEGGVRSARAEVSRSAGLSLARVGFPLRSRGGFPDCPKAASVGVVSAPLARRFPGALRREGDRRGVCPAHAEVARETPPRLRSWCRPLRSREGEAIGSGSRDVGSTNPPCIELEGDISWSSLPGASTGCWTERADPMSPGRRAVRILRVALTEFGGVEGHQLRQLRSGESLVG